MPLHKANTHSRIEILDAWRFLAVILVIACHLVYIPAFHMHLNEAALRTFQSHGRVAVLIFFFISGYVVSRASLAEISRSGKFSVAGFYLRRSFRIVPALMLYLVTCAILGIIGAIPFSTGDFLAGTFYLCNTSIDCGWLVQHTWSLAFEEQFYLIFPAIFCWLELKIQPRSRWLWVTVPIFLAPALFSRLGINAFVQAHFLFSAGYFCARHEHRIRRWMTRHALPILLVATLVTLFPYELYFRPRALWPRIIFTLAIPPMIMASMMVKPLWTRWARQPAILYIGRISYSIYLWQEIATYDGFTNNTILDACVRVLLIFPLAAVLYRYLEQPLLRFGRARAGRSVA